MFNANFKNDGRLKLLIIVGTRPEFIRLSEVIKKCRKYFETVLAHTGQNYDYNLNGVFFRVAWYFAIFFIILIPRFLHRGVFAKPEMRVLKVLAYSAILFMYFAITKGSAYVIPYEFFFQG